MNDLFTKRRYLIPFRSSLLPQIFCDVLVIGSGVAGARAALAAAQAEGDGRALDVIVLSKSALDLTNTSWAQGGIAAVLEPGDTLAAHTADTHSAGAGLCDDPVVHRVIAEGPAEVRAMFDQGMDVDRDADGRPEAGREGGHSASRIYHSGGDQTGRVIQTHMGDQLRAHPGIRVFDRCFALDLITPSAEPGAPVLGAITHHPKFGLQMIWAHKTILASGGAGQVYRETTNPRPATGDAMAMAYRAGAQLGDMAFVQFHPTVLYLAGAPRALVSEAVRGEGAKLLNMARQPFMKEVHPLGDLAPRDVVASAIMDQVAAQGGQHVWLDARHLDGFDRRFPSIHAALTSFGIDPAEQLIPVLPAAHYTIGGVRTDADARASVPNLFAVGECACSGLHGANRLASNSLLEGLVMGAAAGRLAAEEIRAHGDPGSPAPRPVVSDIRPSELGQLDLQDVRSSLRSAMWRNVGLVRAGPQLRDAVEMLDFWGRYTLDKIFDEWDGWETQNLLLVGSLIARSAVLRTESRGTHRRSDTPETLPEWLVHDLWSRHSEEPRLLPVEQPVGDTTVPGARADAMGPGAQTTPAKA